MITLDIDITDTVDLDREWEIPNWDYTADLPPLPDTHGFHPDLWVDIDEDGDQAYAEMLERRAERGTWFGPETEMDRDW